jgi:tRNA pseudouridine38-40 synthase
MTASAAVTYRLTLAYHGGAFAGWQRQPGKETVQGCLENAARKIWGQPISMQASGRTDTGVHALGQVVSFQAPANHSPQTLIRALNANLPPTVRVLALRRAPQEFHARFSATGKIYEYRIWNAPQPDPFQLEFAWHVPRPLDLIQMRRAAKAFIGRHDFAAFTSNPGYARKTTVRTMRRITLRQQGPEIRLRFEADGFLYRMVRNLTGGLVQVGLGKLSSADLKKILAGRQRTAMPPTAPPHGLYLVKVFYARAKRGNSCAEPGDE